MASVARGLNKVSAQKADFRRKKGKVIIAYLSPEPITPEEVQLLGEGVNEIQDNLDRL